MLYQPATDRHYARRLGNGLVRMVTLDTDVRIAAPASSNFGWDKAGNRTSHSRAGASSTSAGLGHLFANRGCGSASSKGLILNRINFGASTAEKK